MRRRSLRGSRAAKVGDIHTWADGRRYQKVAAGKWVQLPKEGEEPDEGKRVWTDHAEGLPHHTVDAYWSPGDVDWSDPRGPWVEVPPMDPDRKALHDRIKGDFLGRAKSVPLDRKPIAIMTMGGPSSGKSSLVRSEEGPGARLLSNSVPVDADLIKEELPEYDEALRASARDAAKMVHAESAFIMGEIRDQAVAERKNVVIDGTGSNAPAYKALIQRLKGNGYHVVLVMPHVEKETALERGRERAEKEGRWVPEHIYDDAYENVPGNFMDIQEEVDEAYLFDTNDFPPTLKWERRGDKETKHDADWFSKFHSEESTEGIVHTVRSLMRESTSRNVLRQRPYWSSRKILEGLKARLSEGEKKRRKLRLKPKRFKKGDGIEQVWDDRAAMKPLSSK
jgi:predicted ABC-type ATPase